MEGTVVIWKGKYFIRRERLPEYAWHSWQLAGGNTVQIRQQESSDFGEADG